MAAGRSPASSRWAAVWRSRASASSGYKAAVRSRRAASAGWSTFSAGVSGRMNDTVLPMPAQMEARAEICPGRPVRVAWESGEGVGGAQARAALRGTPGGFRVSASSTAVSCPRVLRPPRAPSPRYQNCRGHQRHRPDHRDRPERGPSPHRSPTSAPEGTPSTFAAVRSANIVATAREDRSGGTRRRATREPMPKNEPWQRAATTLPSSVPSYVGAGADSRFLRRTASTDLPAGAIGAGRPSSPSPLSRPPRPSGRGRRSADPPQPWTRSGPRSPGERPGDHELGQADAETAERGREQAQPVALVTEFGGQITTRRSGASAPPRPRTSHSPSCRSRTCPSGRCTDRLRHPSPCSSAGPDRSNRPPPS